MDFVARAELAESPRAARRRRPGRPVSSARNGRRAFPMRAARRRPRRAVLAPARAAGRATSIPPGRSSTGTSPAKATIVDSIPTAHAPPSSICATASPRSSATCRAVVGEMRPKRLADGAAMPPPKARSSARATGCDGTRKPTLSWPPVTTSADAGRARQDQRQRSRPEGRRKLPRPFGHRRAPTARVALCRTSARSPDGRRGGPWRQISCAPRPDCPRRRRGRRPFRSGTRRACRRAGGRRRGRWRPGSARRCGRSSVVAFAAVRQRARPLRPEGLPQQRIGRRVLLEFELLRAANSSARADGGKERQ